jgi:hypothetical protein
MAQRPITLNARPIVAREAYGLAAGFMLASAAHMLRLPLWLGALISVVVFWRLYLAYRNLPSPGKWLLGLVAFAAAGGILIEYRTLLGRDAGVALLVVMLALKVLETRTLRDGILLGFLGFFLLVTIFLFSQTITTALYMLGCAWLLIVVLIGMQFTGTWPGWRQPARRAAILLVQALPLMLVLSLGRKSKKSSPSPMQRSFLYANEGRPPNTPFSPAQAICVDVLLRTGVEVKPTLIAPELPPSRIRVTKPNLPSRSHGNPSFAMAGAQHKLLVSDRKSSVPTDEGSKMLSLTLLLLFSLLK